MTRAVLVTTNRNYKQLASPSVLEAFYTRPNKKDSFERWFSKWGAN